MLDKVTEYLEDVVAIADSLPEKYQLKGFEVILSGIIQQSAAPGEEKLELSPVSSLVKRQLPNVLVQKQVSRDEIERVLHFDGMTYNIIVGDLKVTSTSQKQIRLALLVGAKNLLETGKDALVARDELIDTCRRYSAYDSANFARHMKANRQNFLERTGGWLLTIPGQQKASELIKELAQ